MLCTSLDDDDDWERERLFVACYAAPPIHYYVAG